MISKTGDNLAVIINCEYIPHHNWMTFVSWYSVNKFLPDCKCFILCKRGLNKFKLYDWTSKCKVPLYYIKDFDHFDSNKIGFNFEVKHISCSNMAINTWNDQYIGPYDVKLDYDCTFVDYFNQCGSFNGNEWIGSLTPPFKHVSSFYSDDLTLNEHKVFQIWDKCKNIFNLIK